MYKANMKLLMLRFGLRSEGEVILCLSSLLPDPLMADRHATDRALAHAWGKLRTHLRTVFFAVDRHT